MASASFYACMFQDNISNMQYTERYLNISLYCQLLKIYGPCTFFAENLGSLGRSMVSIISIYQNNISTPMSLATVLPSLPIQPQTLFVLESSSTKVVLCHASKSKVTIIINQQSFFSIQIEFDKQQSPLCHASIIWLEPAKPEMFGEDSKYIQITLCCPQSYYLIFFELTISMDKFAR